MSALADPVRQQAEARPEAAALVTPGTTWTWADLDARVGAAAARLAVGPGRLAVWAPTSPDLVVLLLGALRARRTVVPLSTRWTPAAVSDALGRLGLDRLLLAPGLMAPADLPGEPLATIVEGGGDGGAPPLDPARPWTVVHTSGSTGTPKAALHTVGNHVSSAHGVIDRLDLRADGRWLLDLPLYHVGGLGVVVRCVLAGAAMAVPGVGMGTAEAVRTLRPTHASLVTTQLRRLLEGATADDLASLRAVLLGGSAIPAALLDAARQRGVPVATSYGLTEMTATVTATAPGAPADDLATSGTPLRDGTLRISPGGEIEVGGPALFAGYLTDQGLVAPGTWHSTADLGHVDGQGRLVVTGRRDLRFVSGGENVQPEAIEAALLRLDDVAEAVVVPVPDSEFDARPVAFVRTLAPLDAAALAGALREGLPGYMVPVAFYAWPGAGGLKPDRPALTREAERRAAEASDGAGA